jgi:hypothetical protein
MTETAAMRDDLNAGLQWLRESAWFPRRDPALAWGAGFVVAAIAVLLSHVPFVGGLVFVLLAPMLAAGAMRMMRAIEGKQPPVADMVPENDAPAGVARFVWYLRRAARGLFADWGSEERILPVIIVCTLALAFAVAIQILGALLRVGGEALPAMFAGSVGPRIWVPALIGFVLVSVLKFVLTFALIFAVPLIEHRMELPLAAIGRSLRMSGQHVAALLAFLVPFAAAWMLVGSLARVLPFPLDDLLRLATGTVLFPLFAGGAYRAYRACFP